MAKTDWRNRIVNTGVKPAIEYMASPSNWRGHPKAQREALKGVLAEVGWVTGVIENRTTGHLIDGHARIEEALKIGDDTPVPFIEVELTEAEEQLILASLDPLSAMAFADKEKLDALLHEVQSGDAAVQQMLADMAKAAGLDYGAEPVDAEPQVDRAAELQQKWQTATGQLWTLGDHRLLCGDSTKAEDVVRVMQGEKAELLFTSPPYSDIREYGGNDLSQLHKFITVFAPHATYQAVNLGIKRKDDEVIPYWDEYLAEAKRAGLKLLSWNVWDKMLAGSISNQSAMFAIEHEWIFVFGTASKAINRTVDKTPESFEREKNTRHDTSGRPVRSRRQADGSIKYSVRGVEYATKNLPTVIQIPPEMARDTTLTHPAVFPVALPSVYIEAITNAGDCVADPFAGSGTTGIACQKLGRKARMIEISPAYCAVILQRMSDIGLTLELITN